MSVINKVLIPDIPSTTAILDLCCGTGQLAVKLANFGFSMYGVDISEQMLKYACKNVPQGRFFATDARTLSCKKKFPVVISFFDSLNHITEPFELEHVFSNVYCTLTSEGSFLFDMNMREAYQQWDRSSAVVESDYAFFIRGYFDQQEMIGHTTITLFTYSNQWYRYEINLLQRCYDEAYINNALMKAGFREVKNYTADYFDIRHQLGIGRLFWLAKK